jgi:hypothetical protein
MYDDAHGDIWRRWRKLRDFPRAEQRETIEEKRRLRMKGILILSKLHILYSTLNESGDPKPISRVRRGSICFCFAFLFLCYDVYIYFITALRSVYLTESLGFYYDGGCSFFMYGGHSLSTARYFRYFRYMHNPEDGYLLYFTTFNA